MDSRGIRRWRWFSVDSKSFMIEEVGVAARRRWSLQKDDGEGRRGYNLEKKGQELF